MSKKICNVAINMQADKTETEEINIDTTEMGPRTFFGVLEDWFVAFGKWMWKKFHSPMGIYLFSTWLISVLIMGITNSLRGHSFWEGPSYWMNVFLTYGLNGGQDIASRIIAQPVLVWFFAPMVALILGFSLYMLADSGFCRNGAFPVDELDLSQFHRYYNVENIWGSELINQANPKLTNMYIWIVLMPIILGAVVSATYNFIMFKLVQKRKKFIPSVKSFLLIVFIACLIIGTAMALITGDIVLSFRYILFSLFVDRKTNSFLRFGFEYGMQGQYHPMGVAYTTWLLYLIPFLIIYAMFLFIGNLDKIWMNKDYLIRKIVDSIKARKTPVLDFQGQLDIEESEDQVGETPT